MARLSLLCFWPVPHTDRASAYLACTPSSPPLIKVTDDKGSWWAFSQSSTVAPTTEPCTLTAASLPAMVLIVVFQKCQKG